MQLGLLVSEKCGIFIANSICIQYADLQILYSVPKSLLSKLADSLHFPDEPEGTCWWAGDKAEYSSKISNHGFTVCTAQCHLASPRGAGMTLQHACFWLGYELGSWGGASTLVMSSAGMAILRETSLEQGQVPLHTAAVSAVDPPDSIHESYWNEMLFSKGFSGLLKCRRWHTHSLFVCNV